MKMNLSTVWILFLLASCGSKDDATFNSGKASIDPNKQTVVSSHELVKFEGEPLGAVSKDSFQVPIYPSATLFDQGKSLGPVYLTGFAIRKKSVVVMNVDIAVMTSYSDNKSGFNASNPLDSIRRGKRELIQMTMLREVSAEQAQDAIQTNLNTNQVTLTQSQWNQLLSAIGSGTNVGDIFTFVSLLNSDGSESVLIESNQQQYRLKGKDLGTKIWSLWFGIPVDSDAAELKASLIGK